MNKMDDFKKAMRLSIKYGLIGAAVLALMLESYANISRLFALTVVGLWSAVCGALFSRLPAKSAAAGMGACLAYCGVFGVFVYVIIHPAVVSFLEKNSRYFYLSLSDYGRMFVRMLALLPVMFAVCFAVKGLKYAFNHISDNRKSTSDYIDNAFADDSENGDGK